MSDRAKNKKAIAKIYDLLSAVANADILVKNFCDEYEKTYNLELEKNELSEKEGKIFQALFDKVVWYSPFPEERQQISRYLDEKAILHAVEVASKSLA